LSEGKQNVQIVAANFHSVEKQLNVLPNMAFERDAPKAARPSTLRYALKKEAA